MHRRIGWVAPLTLLVFVRSLSAQVVHTSPLEPTITMTAHGEATVIPDRAQISLGVQSRAVSATAAATENARKQDSVSPAFGPSESATLRSPPRAIPSLRKRGTTRTATPRTP